MPVKATDKVFSLRLPIFIYELLQEEARKNKRSVNAEILLSIEEHIKKLEQTRNNS